MPRSPVESDFVVGRRAKPPVSNPAGAFATRWVLVFALLAVFAFAIVCTIAAHIPAGE